MKRNIALLIFGSVFLLTGCETFWMGHNAEHKRTGASSSLVDYLYPNGEVPPDIDHQVPYLELPLRVGVAFVPSNRELSLSAVMQQDLMERVSAAFADRPFVTDIEVIPDVYLKSARGIVGMQQIARMHDVDVMALISYDQVTISGEKDSAILYWTIVGAMVVKGNRNEVQTLVDTAVFDVSTGQLLMRAPGTDTDQANSTLMDRSREIRALEDQGFLDATDSMIVNLDASLEGFRAQVKEGYKANVSWKEGYSGGGGGIGFGLLGCLAFGALRRRQASRGKTTM